MAETATVTIATAAAVVVAPPSLSSCICGPKIGPDTLSISHAHTLLINYQIQRATEISLARSPVRNTLTQSLCLQPTLFINNFANLFFLLCIDIVNWLRNYFTYIYLLLFRLRFMMTRTVFGLVHFPFKIRNNK